MSPALIVTTLASANSILVKIYSMRVNPKRHPRCCSERVSCCWQRMKGTGKGPSAEAIFLLELCESAYSRNGLTVEVSFCISWLLGSSEGSRCCILG